MNLEEIKAAIRADLQIDRFNIVDEIARTPNLFSKYLSIYMDEKTKLRVFQKKYSQMYLERREFLMGKSTDDKYAEEPSHDRKILRQDVEIWLASDDKLGNVKDRLFLQEMAVDILERTLKQIGSRGYELKTLQDAIRFESGG